MNSYSNQYAKLMFTLYYEQTQVWTGIYQKLFEALDSRDMNGLSGPVGQTMINDFIIALYESIGEM